MTGAARDVRLRPIASQRQPAFYRSFHKLCGAALSLHLHFHLLPQLSLSFSHTLPPFLSLSPFTSFPPPSISFLHTSQTRILDLPRKRQAAKSVVREKNVSTQQHSSRVVSLYDYSLPPCVSLSKFKETLASRLLSHALDYPPELMS